MNSTIKNKMKNLLKHFSKKNQEISILKKILINLSVILTIVLITFVLGYLFQNNADSDKFTNPLPEQFSIEETT